MSTGLGQAKLQAYTIIHCDSRNNIPNASTLITTSGHKYVHLNKTEGCKFYRGKDYIRKPMVAVRNEVFKCLLTQKYFPDPVNDSFKDGGGYSLSIIIN